MFVAAVTQEAEVGGSLEPISSSLGYSKTLSQKSKKKENNVVLHSVL